MSGHSKWHNIQARKGKSDAARGKIFTKIGREIAVIVKEGGSDPVSNPKLKDVIAKAKQNNMPNDTIERSIKKAAGEMGGVNYESCTYEGYGQGGSAVIVECLTDNKNRTAGDVRHAFDKFGGALGANGCVSYLFNLKGIVEVEKGDNFDSDELMMTALDLGAVDIVEYDDYCEVITEANGHTPIAEGLEKAGYTVLNSETTMVPDNYVELDAEKVVKFNRMIETLEDLDDVQQVYHNVELPDEE
ncbi:MAG: YebC/PmpR family DNA-binding transcriptional regulator [Clostridia bacterium]|nr:YebC/PmpR family DNA-binding transcriptional regulator [Clostridia bacterium]